MSPIMTYLKMNSNIVASVQACNCVAAANEQGQLRDKCQENNRLAYRCVCAAQVRNVLLLIRGRVQACGC
jgi:hypothetical protein